MASRDLTGSFNERRNARKALSQLEQWSESVADGLLIAVEPESQPVPADPHWVEAFREVEARASAAECELKRMTRRNVFDDHEFRDAAAQVKTHLRQAERLIATAFGAIPTDSDAEAKSKTNARKKLARRFQDLSRQFRDASARSVHFSDGELAFLTTGAEKRALDMLNDGQRVTFEEAQQLEADAAYLDERDKDVEAIAKSVTDISDIFKELAVLVIDQGTVLDRIDFNMEIVADRTRQATAQLMQSDKSSAGAKPVKCVFSLLLVIFVLSLILVYQHS